MASLLAMSQSLFGWLLFGLSQLLSIGHIKMGVWVLLGVFIADFITGVTASFHEKKLNGERCSIYDFRSGKVRLSILKGVTYILFILLSWFFYVYMFDKALPMPGSTRAFTIPEIGVGICIAVESWSIIENFKRLGFDLIGKIQNIASKVWNVINTVKNG